MAFDLSRALLAKEERESARLMDFAFRLRARTLRLLALEIDRDPSLLTRLVAAGDDNKIIERLQSELPESDIKGLYAVARAKAERELTTEFGDPTPHRLA